MRKQLFFVVGLVGFLVSQSLFATESRQAEQIKIVFTGGPCSGKTSLIIALSKLGHNVIEEVATYLIKEGKVHPMIDGIEKFQEAVCVEQKRLEDEAAKDTEKNAWFLDRGMVDGEGYYANVEISVPQVLSDAIEEYKYNVVFILDPVLYTKDGSVRFENPEEATKLHQCMIEAYEKAGYELIVVKNFAINAEQGVESRVSFVLNKLAALFPNQFPPTS